MAETWLAIDPALDRTVVVKLPHLEWMSAPDAREQFLREARLAALVMHPHIAAVFAVGEHDERPYLVSEYVAGETLATFVARTGRPRPDVALRLLAQLAGALDAIHEAGLVHRDLHTANVLVTATGTAAPVVKLIDFGIARRMEPRSTDPQTVPDQVLGFRPFIAPERLRGEPSDRRVDVYALGVIAVVLLTAWQPSAIDGAIRLADIPAVARWSEPQRDVVERALADDPTRRWNGAGAFIDAVARVFDANASPSLPLEASGDMVLATEPQVTKWWRASASRAPVTEPPGTRRDRWRVAPLVLFAALALALAVLRWRGEASSEEPQAAARAETQGDTTPSAFIAVQPAEALAGEPTPAPRVADAPRRDHDGRGGRDNEPAPPSALAAGDSSRREGMLEQDAIDPESRLSALLAVDTDEASMLALEVADSILRTVQDARRHDGILRLKAAHELRLRDHEAACRSLERIPLARRPAVVTENLDRFCRADRVS
ncbi:MAG: serine/threonine protein kinase [Gemmatimonadaceae bacterium]|jgi:serine/threonine-protein kinase|nr:serine/threonine protein kinase [Gemmatimonadaceae bacterium]